MRNVGLVAVARKAMS